MELFTQPPRFTLDIVERPVASPLARLQARAGPRLTNLRHETLTVDEIGRQLILHLDGSRNRAQLRDLLIGLVNEGELSVEEDGQAPREPEKIRQFADKAVEEQLREIARHAMLVG